MPANNGQEPEWTDQEENYLKQYWDSMTAAEISQDIGRTEAAVYSKVYRLKQKEELQSSHPQEDTQITDFREFLQGSFLDLDSQYQKELLESRIDSWNDRIDDLEKGIEDRKDGRDPAANSEGSEAFKTLLRKHYHSDSASDLEQRKYVLERRVALAKKKLQQID